jgi:hypothetical protein
MTTQFLDLEAHVECCSNCQGVIVGLAAAAIGSGPVPPPRPSSPARAPAIPGFVIEREIGRGGTAVVYQAWQPRLARHVAIKVVSDDVGGRDEDRRRWLREAQALGRIRHPNVISLHDAGEQGGCLYLVLDLVAGGSLADRAAGPLPPRVAARLIETVAHAVECLHDNGVSHLDIKPSNILLDGAVDAPLNELTPLLADFGIAQKRDSSCQVTTGTPGVRGTPAFMAPEQIAGKRTAIGPRSDVYALGATLYCLLIGRPPFEGASIIETLDLVRSSEPIPPRARNSDLPRDLETIVMTCLRKDPSERYPSASALAADLERWLHGYSIKARPVKALERAARWCRRRPAIASLTAVLAVTMISSAFGLLALLRYSGAERDRARIALAHSAISDKATSGAIDDVIEMLATTVHSPKLLANEQFNETSRMMREVTARLRGYPDVASNKLVAICLLECEQAEEAQRRLDSPEAHALLSDALVVLEEQRKANVSPDVEYAYARIRIELASLIDHENRLNESLDNYQQAELILAQVVQDPERLDAIFWIDDARRSIARLLERKGMAKQGRELLEYHVAMLGQLSAHHKTPATGPPIRLLATLVRLDLASDQDARDKIFASIEKFPPDVRLPKRYELRLAQWIAKSIYSSRKLTAGSNAPIQPELFAHHLMDEIIALCTRLGDYPGLLPNVADELVNLAIKSGSRQRSEGRLADARQTALFFLSFGKLLVREKSSEGVYHMILAKAYEQQAKNAWKIDDLAAIESSLRAALAEAYSALTLAPDDDRIRLHVSTVRDKLFNLTANHPRTAKEGRL